jgi:putative redox protein
MTIALYARRKEWHLAGVTVRLRRARTLEPGEMGADGTSARRYRIEQDIAIAGELTEEQRARLLSIAERCPVHRTLRPGTPIQTRLA